MLEGAAFSQRLGTAPFRLGQLSLEGSAFLFCEHLPPVLRLSNPALKG
jgi:hypothetical protein